MFWCILGCSKGKSTCVAQPSPAMIALLSSQATFTASNRDIWACGRWSHTCHTHLHAERNTLIGLRDGECGGRNSFVKLPCAANHSRTAGSLKSHTMTTFGKSGLTKPLSCSGIMSLWSAFRRARRSWVCWMCVLTPLSEMAAHIVILPPHWPGVLLLARCPMTLWPCPLHSARLNPSSTKWRRRVASCP